jgi:hypothetical protein
VIRAAVLILSLGLGACATTPALPEFSASHPAHPGAAEPPAPLRPTTLGAGARDVQDAAPAAKPSPEHAGGAHR